VITTAAVILWFGVTCYAVLGGADYGAGFWDLTAGGARRGARPRALIDRAMSPVWEANNVWLIFALVVLWTAFPRAFAAVMSTLFVPMSLAAAGIVLRGATFVFRKSVAALTGRRLLGATFALSSLLTPFFLGASFGAIASGRVRVGDPGGDPLAAWTTPTSMLIGALAVLCAAFLAAVFLVFDARRAGDEALARYFRRRAIGSAFVTGLLAVAGIFVLRDDAPFLYDRLLRQGFPFVFLSASCGVACLTLMASGIAVGTRGLAVGAVGAVLAGWGLAQYPYLLPTSLTIEAGAGAPATLAWVLVVFLIAAVTAVPALGFLFVLDQRGRLEEDATVRHQKPERRRAGAEAARGGHLAGVRSHWWNRAFGR
jgi:cytochrome d ubiquinol oxidase subunit II